MTHVRLPFGCRDPKAAALGVTFKDFGVVINAPKAVHYEAATGSPLVRCDNDAISAAVSAGVARDSLIRQSGCREGIVHKKWINLMQILCY